jgi:hypothetical protein
MNEDYRKIPKEHFADLVGKATNRLLHYGFSVTYSDKLPESAAAEFDGLSFVLQQQMSSDSALFNLLHIFGHSIQWATSPETFTLARKVIVPGTPLPDDELLAIKTYEQQASEYGIQLLHEINTYDLDQWVTDIWRWDWDYLQSVYIRNAPAHPALHYDYAEIPFGRECLGPRPIPEFTPRHYETATVI